MHTIGLRQNKAELVDRALLRTLSQSRGHRARLRATDAEGSVSSGVQAIRNLITLDEFHYSKGAGIQFPNKKVPFRGHGRTVKYNHGRARMQENAQKG
jgi:hypothetical protein